MSFREPTLTKELIKAIQALYECLIYGDLLEKCTGVNAQTTNEFFKLLFYLKKKKYPKFYELLKKYIFMT